MKTLRNGSLFLFRNNWT